jgi:hypothetical protein
VALKVSGVPTVCVATLPKVMLCDFKPEFTVKLCETGVAGAYVLLPVCEAVMVQVPAAAKLAVLPETVQTLVVDEA